MTPPNVPNQQIHQMQRSKSPEENDLTAFNKLISLMKAGAATPVESPKVFFSSPEPLGSQGELIGWP